MDGAMLAHWKSLLKTIKYVVNTRDKVLKLNSTARTTEEEAWTLGAFSDSNFTRDNDSRVSITRCIVHVLGAPVAWKSKGQRSITLSSAKAKYVALSGMVTEMLFVQQLLEFHGVTVEVSIVVNVDNIGA